jgi:hypothetical protein
MQREKNMLCRLLEIHITPNHDDQEVSASQGQSSFQRLEHRDHAQPALVGVLTLGTPDVGSSGDAVHTLTGFADGSTQRSLPDVACSRIVPHFEI